MRSRSRHFVMAIQESAEIECTLVIQMACTHSSAAMAVLSRLGEPTVAIEVLLR